MEKNLDIEIDDAQIKWFLKTIHNRMEDMTPVMRRIGEFIISSVQENFEAGGRYLSDNGWKGGTKKWKQLSPQTKSRREKKGYWPGKILIQRARLAASISSQALPDAVRVGTNVIYAKTMQFGAKRGEFGEKAFTQRVREHLRRVHGKAVKVHSHERTLTLPLPWADIPARPFLVVQEQDLSDIKGLLMEYIMAR